MKIEQFEDKGLAHFSYAILSETTRQIILVDPARNPAPYFAFADANQATITGVIETHPHADFVSSHLEIHHRTGATLYVSKLVGADYPHQPFDDGDAIELGEVKLKCLFTPGHSPDGISIVAASDGKAVAVFTGDTLFIGDVGRPDLRENAGNMTAKREELARQLYKSTREKLMTLQDEVLVYPAHGAGSLCGKALSQANSSTIGAEKLGNYALQAMPEEAFVKMITEDQPFIPKYFAYDVALNKNGAPAYAASIAVVERLPDNFQPTDTNVLIVDARNQHSFKKGHLKGALNIQNGAKFETWLGSIIGPEENFYLLAADEKTLDDLIAKAAKIGYESKIKGAFVWDAEAEASSPLIDLEKFKADPAQYTIIDIRNAPEVAEASFFKQAMHIPLPELRERAQEVPLDKPIVVHCAGGYRSAAGSSILEKALPKATVLDLSEAVTSFQN
ncbi:rhodanese-like domain-containing protein [Pontibacter sp. SGAir0037]|uniref:MBL fold metallo-hydrolase n=1 Tax=Pontibacter sp. SGAir0037 TaxID=2571030 RepID=UPI0010CD48CA|nr:MBL fold metallo-hydrolase [Pontibacter sp. SGAir0037]QCR21400.1 MBL fold metallo-hydrolase [Pontibacter sp. SGAir0037]